MTLEEYSCKTCDVQIDIVKEIGVLVGEREHTHHNIKLFQVDTFYVEVFLRKKDDTIWKIGAFDHHILLQPYLDKIDLTSLLHDM